VGGKKLCIFHVWRNGQNPSSSLFPQGTDKQRNQERERAKRKCIISTFDANTSHFLNEVNFAPIEHYQRGEVKIYVFVPKGNKLKIEAQFQGVDLIEVIETTDCG
jgi:hypothetical protein